MADGSRLDPRVPYNPDQQVAPVTAAPNDYLGNQANPETTGAQIGKAIQGIGDEVQGVAKKEFDVGMKYLQMQMDTKANNASNDMADSFVQMESDFKQKYRGQEAVDKRPEIEKQMRDKMNELSESMPSPYAKLEFQRAARNYYNNTITRLGYYVDNEGVRAADMGWKDKLDNIDNQAILNPTDPNTVQSSLDHKLDTTLQYAHFLGISDPESIHGMVSKEMGKTVDGIIWATATQHPDGTAEQQQADLHQAESLFKQYDSQTIPGESNTPYFTDDQRNQTSQKLATKEFYLQGKIDREDAKAESQARVGIRHAMTNIQAAVDNGVQWTHDFPTDDQIHAAYKNEPESEAIVKDQRDLLQATNDFVPRIADATQDQVNTMLQQAQPDVDKPEYAKQQTVYKALQGAVKARDAALHNDSIGYGISHDTDLNKAWAAATKDPKQLPAFFQKAQTWQTQIGIPDKDQSLLPKNVTQSLATSVMNDPLHAKEQFSKMEKTYGTYWPQIFGNMVQHGNLSGMFQAIANMDDKDGQLLGRFLTDQASDKRKPQDLMATGDVQKIKRTITNNPEIGKMASSVGSLGPYMGGTYSVIANMTQAAENLAIAKMIYSHESVDQASSEAITAITGQYQFHPNGDARIPTNQFPQVVNYTQDWLGDLGNHPDRIAVKGEGFERASDFTLAHEGGYSAKDANGYSVNFGINQKFHPEVGDVKNLTKQGAKDIYRNYWNESGAGKLPPGLDVVQFDTAIVFGSKAANKMLVESGNNPYKYMQIRRQHMADLIAHHPDQFQRFSESWNKRNNDLTAELNNSHMYSSTPDYIKRLQTNPTWVTNEDESGLYLKDPEGNFVYGPNGHPVELRFKDAKGYHRDPEVAANPYFGK